MDKISELLGTQTGIVDNEVVQEITKSFDDISDNLRKNVKKLAGDDYQFSRDQLRDAIAKCATMLPGLVALANVAESPLLYNSAASFFKVFSDMNSSLLDASSKMDKIANNSPKQESRTTTTPAVETNSNAGELPSTEDVVFEGTTADLLSKVLEEVKASKAKLILEEEE